MHTLENNPVTGLRQKTNANEKQTKSTQRISALFPYYVSIMVLIEAWTFLEPRTFVFSRSPGALQVTVNMAGGAHSHGALSTATALTPATEELRAIAVSEKCLFISLELNL